MSSAFHSALAIAALLTLAAPAGARELRVCLDPDNAPLSSADGSGLENRLARLVAGELGATLRPVWTPWAHGFVRKTLGSGLCDALMGVPAGFDRVATTRPYYRSSYVFVSGPRARGIDAPDDPRLARLKVGVPLVGDDLAATPPGHALAAAGFTDNVRGYPVLGEGSAAQRMVRAVASGELDTALLWGPQAASLAARAALEVRVASPTSPMPPFEFGIAMGVGRGNSALRDELDGVIQRRRGDIDALLEQFAVPRLDAGKSP
jgi:mxaJ protein